MDGDGTAIPLRVDSTLNSAANLLTPGSIVLIESFIPIHFKYEDHADDRCVIVIKQFEVKGHHSLPEELLKRPTKRAKPSKETEKIKQKAIASQAPLKRNTKHQCDGSLCW